MYDAKLRITPRDMTYSGMFAAVIAVLAQAAVPMPSGVSVTLQTFAVALVGYTLGGKRGTMAAVIYVLLGAAGMPVFAGLKGGLTALAGPTGGFIWGFVPMAFLCGAGTSADRRFIAIAAGIAGLLVCHLLGVMHFSAVSGSGFAKSAATVSLPFLIKDSFSVAAAYMIAQVIRRRAHIQNT